MIRILIYSIGFLSFTLLSCLVILSTFFSSGVDRWLSLNSPVEAEIMILEGWTSPGLLEQAALEFHEGSYSTLITTGGPLDKAYNMSMDGRIMFDINAAGVNWKSGDTVTFALFAYGEPAMGVNARYTIVHRDDTIARAYAQTGMERYDYRYVARDEPAGEVFVIYDNDIYTNDEDRNLHIWKLEIDDVTIPVRSEYTRLIRRTPSGIISRPLFQKTLAQEKAFQLIKSGVDSCLIIVLDVPYVSRLRTYTDAVTVNEWLKQERNLPVSVNVFSQGNHARRSHTLYKYALPDSVTIGILSTGSRAGRHLRFMGMDLNISTLRELGAYVYTRIGFNPGWHYRRIIKRSSGESQKFC
jgi:hypothetical protein